MKTRGDSSQTMSIDESSSSQDKETIIKQQFQIKVLENDKKDLQEKIDELSKDVETNKGNLDNYKKAVVQKLKALKEQNTKLKKKTREQEEMVKTVEELQAIIQNSEKNVLPSNNLNQYNQIRQLKDDKIKLQTQIETLEDDKVELKETITDLQNELNRLTGDLQKKAKQENDLKFTINVPSDIFGRML